MNSHPLLLDATPPGPLSLLAPWLPCPWEHPFPSTLLCRDLGPLELRGQAALCEIVVFPSPGKELLVVPLSALLREGQGHSLL